MSDAPRVSTSISSSFKFGHKVESWQLKDWLETLPAHASISVTHYKGDQREPEENTFTATWDHTKETM